MRSLRRTLVGTARCRFGRSEDLRELKRLGAHNGRRQPDGAREWRATQDSTWPRHCARLGRIYAMLESFSAMHAHHALLAALLVAIGCGGGAHPPAPRPAAAANRSEAAREAPRGDSSFEGIYLSEGKKGTCSIVVLADGHVFVTAADAYGVGRMVADGAVRRFAAPGFVPKLDVAREPRGWVAHVRTAEDGLMTFAKIESPLLAGLLQFTATPHLFRAVGQDQMLAPTTIELGPGLWARFRASTGRSRCADGALFALPNLPEMLRADSPPQTVSFAFAGPRPDDCGKPFANAAVHNSHGGLELRVDATGQVLGLTIVGYMFALGFVRSDLTVAQVFPEFAKSVE